MPAGRAANPNSVINTLLRRIRFYLDDPEQEKYTDNDFLDLIVPPAIQEVWGYMHQTADDPIIASFSIDVEPNTTQYILPPSVQSVHGLVKQSDDGEFLYERTPRGKPHLRGPNWYIEGNVLRWDPKPSVTETLVLMYTPAPDHPMSYSDNATLDSGKTGITLPNYPQLGFRDKRVNGYVGAAIRILDDNGTETRIISSYDPDSQEVTVRQAFTVADAGTVTYEIFPIGTAAFTEAVALSAVLKLAAARGLSAARTKHFMDLFRQARRTETQRVTNLISRRGKHIDRVTRDNPAMGLQNLFGTWWVL
jgi:hypothetical protein